MKPKSLLIAFLLSCILVPASAQDFKSRFKEIFPKGNADSTLSLLNQWRKATPNDPEFYVYAYNFYAKEGLKEVVAMTTVQPDGKSFEIKDKDKKVVGYLGSTNNHNDAYLQKGFNYIDTGISKYPDRLDMRFGKVYILGRIKNYKLFTEEIIKAINYGETINLKWKWTEGKPVEDPKEFMLSGIQEYVVQLFNENDDKYIDNIKNIALTVLKYHPDHVESLSNLAISYLVNKDYRGALQPLLKAEKLNPKDYIVLNNIAYSYSFLGDKPNALKYYELVIKYGDDEAKKTAAEKIDQLKK
ncbi:tetratricopeptide repeat protein [Mucilaginibacter terrigena]|uniref:Tetratricopeptide repeat protein n=1 Tax=Mucilaginibacter terrigena TaxID=2492395 RepID=A0A4Q5LKU7_9SPHI|nr:tetratricopeptide repeat protein [Mucilaginibacter terrigena]RYU90187.1 tetratricopeptide repeat protein [Mucilaginibacter terrigena]